MKQGLLAWSPCRHFLSRPTPLSLPTKIHDNPRRFSSISATVESVNEQSLTARERRQLRNERRESKTDYNWKEEVENRLAQKLKKKITTVKEERNLDNLARMGPQWWILRVSKVSGHFTCELLARSLVRRFPDVDFKVYSPVVKVTRKLKNGSYSVKPKALFPGNVFLRCVLNKEIHDFIRGYYGVYGFIGSMVGNVRRTQINKPRPVSTSGMEAIFQQEKEQQEKADEAFKEEQEREETLKPEKMSVVSTDSGLTSGDSTESIMDSKPKRQSRKTSRLPKGDQLTTEDNQLPRPGSIVRVVSGAFAEFAGVLEKLNRKTKRATVGLALFGKHTLVDLDVNEIVLETK